MTKWRSDYSEPEDNDPAGSSIRVLRGGSWGDLQSLARAAFRYSSYPFDRGFIVGFRVVRPHSL